MLIEYEYRNFSVRRFGSISKQPVPDEAVNAISRAFNRLRDTTFDGPVRLINDDCLWTYVRDNVQKLIITEGADKSVGDRGTIQIRMEGSKFWDSDTRRIDQDGMHSWMDEKGFGLCDLALLIVHEAYHSATGVGHDVDGEFDSSLAHGGAWAAQYWANIAFSQHRQMPNWQRRLHKLKADRMIGTVIRGT
jgi:hypothetical protein